METEDWKNDKVFFEFTSEKCFKLATNYHEFTKAGNSDKTKYSDFVRKYSNFLSALMIRRIQDFQWFGQRMVTTVPYKARDYDCPVKPEWKDKVLQSQKIIKQAVMAAYRR
jgi:hypothetical protein